MNVQYSRLQCFQVVGIPSFNGDRALEYKVYSAFQIVEVGVGETDIPSCYLLKKDRSRIIATLSNKKSLEGNI